jgi:hypothetical protein
VLLSRSYSNNIELRNAISQTPSSIIILHEEIDRVDKTKIDTESLKEEWFFDLFNKTFDNCVNTRFRERIRLNCKIFAGAISLDNVHNRQQAEDFLSFEAELTPTDIMLGLKIYQQQKNKPIRFRSIIGNK